MAAQSRWTPPPWWPVLPSIRLAGRHDGVPRSPTPSDTRWPSLDGRRSPARCAAGTSPAAPAPRPAVSSVRPRRSSRRWITLQPPSSTSRSAIRGGRFSSVHQWPVLTVHRGSKQKSRNPPGGDWNLYPEPTGLGRSDADREAREVTSETVTVAVVLTTPDDEGHARGEADEKRNEACHYLTEFRQGE